VARLLFVFLDGLGLGDGDPAHNPLAAPWPGLRTLTGCDWTAPAWRTRSDAARVTAALDARLGLPGLPQSATGQTTLLTGRNAARAMGRHYGPWPGPTLRALLARGSLFHDGAAAGGARLANAYPAAYLTALRMPPTAAGGALQRRARRARASAPIAAAEAAGLTLADVGDLARDRAVAGDLGVGRVRAGTGSAAVASQARALAALASEHAFTFFDVWGGDLVGHRQDPVAARAFLSALDAFVPALVAALPHDVTLLVTSDHGNLDDLRRRGHTLASVPLLALGPGATAFAGARSLLDVAPAVRQVLATGAARASRSRLS